MTPRADGLASSDLVITLSGAPSAEARPDVALQLLDNRAADYASKSRAEATVKAYTTDFTHFTNWCEQHGLDSLPATPETVTRYITHLAEDRRPSTITRRLSSISIVHKTLGHPSPTSAPAVHDVMTGIRRTLGTATAEARPISLGDLHTMLAHTPPTTIGLRDRAVLLVGFAGGLRRSEIVATNVEDLDEREQGLAVRIRRSKTDQEARGREVALPYATHDHTCPVRAIAAWRSHADIDDGPLFRSVDRHGNVAPTRLSAQAVNLIVKRAAERADIVTPHLSGHSLRAGFATTAAANGATERAIANQTGHRSMNVLRGYIRRGSLFVDNAALDLGL